MTEKNISDGDNILRWVPKTKLRHDPDTLEPIGPQPNAFRLRVEDSPPEPYLSVSWVEHFVGEKEDQIKATAARLAKQVHTNPFKGGAFALGQVGAIKADCANVSGLVPKIISTPSTKKPAYAQVWGIPHDDLALQTKLAFGSWGSILKAIDILEA